MNVLNLAQSTLAGFLCSMIVLELLAITLKRKWPAQQPGFQLEMRLLPWLLALLAGPALFFDATARYRRMRAGSLADCVTVWGLLAVWSASYGLVLTMVVRLV